MDALVIKKKPLFYKLGAKIFKWLVLSNKIVEFEKVGKVIEANNNCVGMNIAWQTIDELNKEIKLCLRKKQKNILIN
jgi:hypothetical protein